MAKNFLVTTVNLDKNKIVSSFLYNGESFKGSDYEKHLSLRVGKTFTYEFSTSNADFNGITTITRIA